MKKNDTDIQDIYRSEDSNPEPGPTWKIQELIEREIRRQLIFNISVGLLIFVLAVFLTTSIIKDAFSPAEEPATAVETPRNVASYTLPPDEQWAIEYRQVAVRADGSEAAGPKDFSTKWLKNIAYHIIMGEQALRMNELEAAQQHLEFAVATFPEMAGIRRHLGAVYLKRQYFEKAVEQLQAAMNEAPSIDLLNNLGAAYMGTGDYARSEALLKQALQQQPDLAGSCKNLALLYQKTGRTNEASAAFKKYFSLNPQDTAMILSYADSLSASGQLRDTMEFLEGLEGADPLAVSLLTAKTAARAGDAERAVRALQKASHFITPRRTIAEMHDAAFDKIAHTEPFEAFLYRLELAAVSLSTNFDTKVESEH